MAKIAASYNTSVAYDAVPINRGKQILEDYYIKIWNAIYFNSANASHTKLFIPSIFHRLSLTLWPNFILTPFLTNHGSFRSYLHEINKTPSPIFSCPQKAGPPLWSSGQSFWLQIQRSRVRFPALPDFLSSSGSGTGSTQSREVN